MSVVKQEAAQIKSKERVSQRGEVFTAEREVNSMLDLVANECLRPDSRFLEPACGDGNFLSAILKRKLTELRRKYKKSSIMLLYYLQYTLIFIFTNHEFSTKKVIFTP